MIETHERVAWAWLDKLVGKTEPRGADVPAREMPRAEREKLVEQAYETTRDDLVAAIGAAVPDLARGEGRISKKYGLDPLFVNWFIVNGRGWPSLAPKTRDALRALQSVHLWFGAVPDEWSRMVIPDVGQEDARDAALREIGEWFLASVVKDLRRRYLEAVWRKARELVAVFRGGGPAEPDAGVLLLRDFKRRLVGDRFQEKPAVGRIVDLF